MLKICAIVAMDEGRVIGHQGGIPWRLKEDMQRFKALTMGHTVIMGRRTYESLPASFRPLPGRRNVVISRNPMFGPAHPEVETHVDVGRYFQRERGAGAGPDRIFWIIGGAELYKATIPFWDELYLTLVRGSHPGDTFFPEFEEQFIEVNREIRDSCSFINYARRSVEQQ